MRILIIAVVFALRLSAALPVATVWEVRPTVGADTNGGGFVTGSSGTDWTQQNAAQYALTNGVTNGTTTVATVSASADMVGNIAYIAGGTGSITAGWYQIVSQSTGVSITVDRSTGLTAGTGVTINIGGALSTISQANTNAVVSNVVWVKATGTYTVTTTLTITLVSTLAPATPYSIIGYTTTRGDGGQVTWTTSTNSVDLIHMGGVTNVTLANFILSSTAGTPGYGITTPGSPNTPSTNVQVINCKLSGFLIGIYGDWTTAQTFQGLYVLNTRITACATQGLWTAGNTYIYGSMIDRNGSDGANWAPSAAGALAIWWVVENSIFSDNAGNGLYQRQTGASTAIVTNSDFSSNTGSGLLTLNTGGAPYLQVSNSIFDANGAYGLSAGMGSDTPAFLLYNNAFYNNTTAATLNVTGAIGSITLSTSPYVSVGTNFALNNTAGGGAAVRAAGFPSTIPAAGSGAPAVGALQPSGAGSGQHGFPVVQ